MNDTLYALLRNPVVTEKTNDLREEYNQFVFKVRPDANKLQIREAVESAFKVRVIDVRTLVVRGKEKRFRKGTGKAPNWKKAIVTLAEGHAIDLFEGM